MSRGAAVSDTGVVAMGLWYNQKQLGSELAKDVVDYATYVLCIFTNLEFRATVLIETFPLTCDTILTSTGNVQDMPAEAVALDLNIEHIEKDDIARVREIMAEFGFHTPPIDDGPTAPILNYQPIGHTDDNIELVEECVQRLSDAFPDAEVSYEIRKNRDAGQVVGKRCYIQIGTEASGGTTDGQRTTTDYRTGNSEETSDDHSRVNSPVEDEELDDKPEWRASDSSSRQKERKAIDWQTRSEDIVSEGESTDDSDSQSQPETVAEWEMWYPCPNCGSTKLNQITESHLVVSVTEDGAYEGEQGSVDEYNYVECYDCGAVLTDEIGKDG